RRERSVEGRVTQPQWQKEIARGNHALGNRGGGQQPLQRSGKARLLQRKGQETRARPGKDDNLRVARNRRQGKPRKASGIVRAAWFSILRLNERRRNVFSRTDVDAATEFAVAHAVQKINRQADDEPDKEASPCFQRQAQHQYDAKEHAEKREQRNQRNTKRPRPVGLFTP